MTLAFDQLRLWQVRICIPWLNRLDKAARVRPILRNLQQVAVARKLLSWMAGYHRPYASLSEASRAIGPLANGGHANGYNARLHLSLSESARPSDYPALFHLQSILPGIHSIFDLGGNVGNLFYCYARYLNFPLDLTWTVFDLPEMQSQGRALASEREESRLRFTSSFESMSGSDLLIASGSLHYFEEPLHQALRRLPHKPKYVLINRTPLAEDGTAATVQDNGVFLVPCTIFDRRALIAGFVDAGYHLVDQWPVTELSLQIPLHPELSVAHYSGMFFRFVDSES